MKPSWLAGESRAAESGEAHRTYWVSVPAKSGIREPLDRIETRRQGVIVNGLALEVRIRG
jgi:hypothetical protein